MKNLSKNLVAFIIIPLLFLYANNCFAQQTYDWTNGAGTGNLSWKTPSNWAINGVTATTYPGQTSNQDRVQFGINYFYGNSQRPDVMAGDSVSVRSVTIGDNTNTNNQQAAIWLRVDGTLNVIDTILQKHSNNIGLAGIDTSYVFPPGYDYSIQTYLYGNGKVYCQTFQVGDNTLSIVNGVNNITRFNIGNGSSGQGLTTVVSGDFIVNSVTKNDAGTDQITSVSNANFAITGGTLTVGGQVKLQNTGDIVYTSTQFQPQARFSMQVFNNALNTVLYLKNAHALYDSPGFTHNGNTQYGSNYFDFYVMDRQSMISVQNGTPANWGRTTVVYSGNTDQEVYTNASFPLPPPVSNAVFDNDGGVYQYLEFSGSGKKTLDATSGTYPFTISGNITLDAGSETVDLSTNNPTLVLNNNNIIFTSYGSTNYTYTIPIASSFTSGTGSTFQNGSVALTIPGTTTNGGTFNTSSSNGLIMTGAFTNTGTFNESGAGVVTASNTTANSGTYNQAGTGSLAFTGAVTNTGTINESNTGTINVNNTYTSSGASSLFSQSSGTINFNNSYTNGGTFRATGGTVNLNQSGAQSLTDNSSSFVGSSITAAYGGTTFFNVNVQNGGTKTLSGTGQFYVASTGKLNMLNNTTLNANGVLTLVSDANGAATVTAIPSGCSITGNVDVQRYVSPNRAYRLVSSPVYTDAAGGNNVYRVNYLETNTYLTGTGSGFDKVGNPTLYLYRENNVPQYTTFLNSNFRGIADISSPPDYQINLDGGPYNIPVGNGYLFYFRGSRKQASLATLTTAGAAATTDTLNAVGTLNQGNVTVHDWYTPGSANLGRTTVSGDPTIEGMNLIGNPYASSIDWDQYGSGIIENQVGPFSYKLIPTGLQGAGNYDVYQANTNIGGDKEGTQHTPNANIIASGEGFFVQATGGSASLTFTEAAKTNTLVTGGNLYMMTRTQSLAAMVPQYMRLQLAMDTINTDGTIIEFNGSAATIFNPAEDAVYRAGTGKVSLASLSSDNVPLAINQLPLTAGTIIPLKVNASASGNYTLNMKNISGVPQIFDVWLKDAFTKDSVNMRTTTSYSFTVNTSDTTTFGSKRFSLIMEEDPALAYKLLSFTAQKVDNKPQVQLVWSAQNEQNYTHFTVERSNDGGSTFNVIGGFASSGLGTYSLVDKAPEKGENQYRLKQEDFNGTITYSDIVTVMYSGRGNSITTNLSIYPNPVQNTLNLTIVPKNGVTTYDVKITNCTGTIVKYAVITQTSWQNNVSNLLTGTYLVQVIDSRDNSIIGETKFVKL